VQRGISPDGEHLIPALPYTSYARMKVEDILDIRAYLATLPPVTSPPRAADMPLPVLIRRGVGLWKWAGLDTTPWTARSVAARELEPRLLSGERPRPLRGVPHAAQHASWRSTPSAFAGGPHPEGDGRVPNLRGLIERGRYKDAKDIASALQFGEMLGYDKISSGGMGQVQRNISQLPEPDILAIGEYLASLKQ
jgi:hypothetical protein